MTNVQDSKDEASLYLDQDIAQIPMFPTFKRLELSDYEDVVALTKGLPPYSDFDFGSMYAWNFTENHKAPNRRPDHAGVFKHGHKV